MIKCNGAYLYWFVISTCPRSNTRHDDAHTTFEENARDLYMLGCLRVTHVINPKKKGHLQASMKAKPDRRALAGGIAAGKVSETWNHLLVPSEFRCIELQLIASPEKAQRKACAGPRGHT